jgi:high-affinity Fe2+/Pb2+ permease
MEQLTGGKRGDAAESPDRESEASERRRGWYVAAVGYVLTVAAFLGWLGTELLPTSTLAEKSLIIVACLVLGLASLVGYGAWRSAWRFAVTVSAGGFTGRVAGLPSGSCRESQWHDRAGSRYVDHAWALLSS